MRHAMQTILTEGSAHTTDRAIYRAKTEGRTRVVVFDPADAEVVHSGLA